MENRNPDFFRNGAARDYSGSRFNMPSHSAEQKSEQKAAPKEVVRPEICQTSKHLLALGQKIQTLREIKIRQAEAENRSESIF